EQREQERDGAERLLAAGEQAQPLHLLAGRPQLDLDSRLRALLLGLCEDQPPLPAGEECRRHLVEVALDGFERLGEARLDRPGEIAAEPLEPLQAALQAGPLLRQLGEPLLLRLVLLLRERVHLPERLAAALAARKLLGQLVAVLAFRGLGPGRREPTLRLL